MKYAQGAGDPSEGCLHSPIMIDHTRGPVLRPFIVSPNSVSIDWITGGTWPGSFLGDV